MGLNTKQLYNAAGKGDLLFFDPEQLVIVTDPSHPLYDERAELEPDADLIANVKYHGVLQPIIVRKNGEHVEVVAGRQRVKACAAANKDLRKEGLQPLRVPAVTKRGEDFAMLAMLISENEQRIADTPIVRAKKVQRFLDLGRSMEEAAIVFGKSLATIKSDVSLLELPTEVQTALETGAIPTTAAKTIAKLPPEKRERAIKQKAAKKGKRERKSPEKASGSKREAKKLIEVLKKSKAQWGYSETGFAAMVLEYVFGLRDQQDFRDNHPELFK